MSSLRSRLGLLLIFALAALPALVHAESIIQFSSASYAVIEGIQERVNLRVIRVSDLDKVVTVDFSTTNLTALSGVDYVPTAQTLTFNVGETNLLVSIPIVNDGIVESAKTFQALLSNPGAGALLGSRSKASVRIDDNDKGVQFELPSYSVNEDAGSVAVRVVRQDDGPSPITVEYFTIDGTAKAGTDYAETKGLLTFLTGEAFKTITIPIFNDAVRESSRTVRLALTNITGGLLASTLPSLITITDSDELTQFQTTSIAVLEGARAASIVLTRGESLRAGSLQLSTVNGTALAGVDYTGVTNQVAFAAGERRKVVEIPLLDDDIAESSKTFRVILTNPDPGIVLGTRTSLTVTILDDDPGAGFQSTAYSVGEMAGRVNAEVARGNDLRLGPFSVQFYTTNQTALAGVDYQEASGVLEFAVNERVKRISIPILANTNSTASKSFGLRLDSLAGDAVLTRSSTTVTITDASKGFLDAVRPGVISRMEKVKERPSAAWEGKALMARAKGVSGPWETSGTLDSPLLPQGGMTSEFYIAQSTRPARLYIPSRYDGKNALPLLLVLHGYGSDGLGHLAYFGMEPLAETRNFLICHPDGTVDAQNSRFWNATEGCCNFYGAEVDDASYLRSLIETIASRYAIDRRRIFLTGHSNGGFMSLRMARDFPDLIAAAASLAGAGSLDEQSNRPRQPVNILQIHGTADGVVPYLGGTLLGLPVTGRFPGALATVQIWARWNGATNPAWDADPTMDLDLSQTGLDTTVMRYSKAPPGGAVELWTIGGAAHSPTFQSGSVRSEFATRVVDWLLAHPKPAAN